MKFRFKHIKYFLYSVMPFIWYNIGTHDKKYTRIVMYNKGLALSQKFKRYPVWDAYVEIFAIRQFTILFTAGNAFIKGMVADNDDKINVELDKFNNDIEEELKFNNNKE